MVPNDASTTPVAVSAGQARRIALAAQGFGRARPAGAIDAGHRRESHAASARIRRTCDCPSRSQRRGWSCCHVWGVDDPQFASRNSIVRDRFTGTAVLSPDVAEAFPSSESVNEALRALIDIARRSAAG